MKFDNLSGRSRARVLLVSVWVPVLAAVSSAGCSDTARPQAPPQSRRPSANEESPARNSFSLRAREAEGHAARACRGRCLPDSARGYDVDAYELRGAFDWTAQRLNALVRMDLHTEVAGLKEIELDSRVLTVKSARANGSDLPFETDTAAGLLKVNVASLALGSGAPLVLEIAYEAGLTPEGLYVSSGSDGDPNQVRVVVSRAEPTFGADWMPANHRPADRATFAIELDVDAEEDVVANGVRAPDRRLANGRKRVRYASPYTMPTYTMAFAQGDLVQSLEPRDVAPLETPISVWHRRGLAVDTRAYIGELRKIMRTYESVLGPYPFGAYAVALLPDYPGGEENTSISFIAENSAGGGPFKFTEAHELAHQWFGDLVTIRTFDDLWIKEGFATFLTAFAIADDRDFERRGRLFGDEFYFDFQDAIRDRALGRNSDPLARFTTGPYDRAAWLLNQLAARLGSAAFFDTVRGVLRDYAFRSIGTDELLAAFDSKFDAVTRAQIKASVDSHEGATLSVAKGTAGASGPTPSASSAVFTLSDPGHVVFAPLEIDTFDARGVRAATISLVAGTPSRVTIPPGGSIAMDSRDVHFGAANVFGASASDESHAAIDPYLWPSTHAGQAALLSRSAADQESALSSGTVFTLTPGEFPPIFAALDSRQGRAYSLASACELRASASAAEKDAWQVTLVPLLRASNLFEYPFSYKGCGGSVARSAFGPEFSRLFDVSETSAYARVQYVMNFDFGAAESLRLFAAVARSSRSVTLRALAVVRLSKQAQGNGGYEAPTPTSVPPYQSFFREALAVGTSAGWLRAVIPAVNALGDAGALPSLAASLPHYRLTDGQTQNALCKLAPLARANPLDWTAFQTALAASMPIGPLTRAVLDDPTTCR